MSENDESAWAESDDRQIRPGAVILRGEEGRRHTRELLMQATEDDPENRKLLMEILDNSHKSLMEVDGVELRAMAEHLGSEIKRVRLAAEFSVEELAEKVGEEANYLEELELGWQIPRAVLLMRIARACDGELKFGPREGRS